MPVGDNHNSGRGVSILSFCSGGVGSSTVTQFSFLILLFLSGSIMFSTSPVVAASNHRSLRNVLSNLNSDLKYNYISRALERLHFGPLLRLRSVKLASDLSKSKEKKALSYLSRFYPILQYSQGSAPRKPSLSFSSSRRRTNEGPGGRFTRPNIMRLRWGK